MKHYTMTVVLNEEDYKTVARHAAHMANSEAAAGEPMRWSLESSLVSMFISGLWAERTRQIAQDRTRRWLAAHLPPAPAPPPAPPAPAEYPGFEPVPVPEWLKDTP